MAHTQTATGTYIANSARHLGLVTCTLMALLAAPLPALRAQGPTLQTDSRIAVPDDTAAQLAVFDKMGWRDRADAFARLMAAFDGRQSSYLDGVRAAAAASAGNEQARGKPLRVRKSKQRGERDDDGRLPARGAYQWGTGRIGDSPSLAGSRGSKRTRLEEHIAVELFLSGIAPCGDLAAIEIMRRLDADTAADRFARFLESWRNGDESFYEALDRTAGSKDGVFFYDAMLGDFVGDVCDKKDPATKALRKSHDAAHDALHRSFLAYRQYRAFREVLAYSFVTPPDRALPTRLARYEQKNGAPYSLREQVMMVLAAYDHDVDRFCAAVSASAPPLPQPLWSESYSPWDGWSEVFEQAIPVMIEQCNDTDAYLLRAVAERQGIAAELGLLAREVLSAKS